MKLVRPATVDAPALVSSNAGEAVPLWSSATTYPLDAQVRSGQRIYASVQVGNLNHAVTDASWWVDMGPSNVWAMFDQVVGTETRGAAGLDVSIKPVGRVDCIALLNVDAAQVRVTVSDDTDGVIFDQTFTMVSDSGIIDWYAYFYEPIIRTTDLIVSNIPLYNQPTIRVRATAGGNPVSIGAMIVGQSKAFGDTAISPRLGIADYSLKEADAFGNYKLVPRPFARKGSFSVRVDNGMVDEVYRILSGYRATPILYIGSDDFRTTAIFGFFREFSIEIAYPTFSLCSLDLEGLT